MADGSRNLMTAMGKALEGAVIPNHNIHISEHPH
jgi:hypothetical protein